ncbi:hypothetical protein JOS77_06220 [Chromobacterium haemolyticum]|nr:hypothetical protein JOS77_06220 [Chromobacterium haemolyticum]
MTADMSASLRLCIATPFFCICSAQAVQQPQYGSLCITPSAAAASGEIRETASAAAAQYKGLVMARTPMLFE